MAQYKIISDFHNRSFTTNIKDSYKSTDVLIQLDYEIYNHGPDETYAQQKLKTIKHRLCGQPDCKCIFHATEIKALTR